MAENEEQNVDKRFTCVYVANAGKFLKLKKFKSELQECGVQFSKIECKSGQDQVYVLFDDQFLAQKGFEVIQKMKNYQNKTFKCKLLENFALHKKKRDEPQSDDSERSCCINAKEMETQSVLTVQSPLLMLSLDEQLQNKAKMIRNAVSNQLHRVIQGQMLHCQFNKIAALKAEKHVPLWAHNQGIRNLCLRCPGIFAAPVQRFYRSKGEFMIQLTQNDDHSSQFKTGSFYRINGNQFHVYSAEEMKQSLIFPKQFIQILEIIEDILNEFISVEQKKSMQEAFQAQNYVIIKSVGHLENADQNEITSQNTYQQENSKFSEQIINPSQKYVVDQLLVSFQLKEEVEDLIQQRILNVLRDRTRHFEVNQRIKVIYELFGDENFIEQQLGSIFARITAPSFFQVNLSVQLLLLNYVKNVIENNFIGVKSLKIADLCCGSGVIGQFLLSELKISGKLHCELLGVEIIPEAVAAAISSAERNKLQNQCQYICGPIEAHRNLISTQDVVILDPPRSGTHISVLNTLRSSHINFIIYIACNPKTLANSLYTLTCIDKQKTIPFYIKEIKAFDMFPGCAHVETVVILQRCAGPDGGVAGECN